MELARLPLDEVKAVGIVARVVQDAVEEGAALRVCALAARLAAAAAAAEAHHRSHLGADPSLLGELARDGAAVARRVKRQPARQPLEGPPDAFTQRHPLVSLAVQADMDRARARGELLDGAHLHLEAAALAPCLRRALVPDARVVEATEAHRRDESNEVGHPLHVGELGHVLGQLHGEELYAKERRRRRRERRGRRVLQRGQHLGRTAGRGGGGRGGGGGLRRQLGLVCVVARLECERRQHLADAERDRLAHAQNDGRLGGDEAREGPQLLSVAAEVARLLEQLGSLEDCAQHLGAVLGFDGARVLAQAAEDALEQTEHLLDRRRRRRVDRRRLRLVGHNVLGLGLGRGPGRLGLRLWRQRPRAERELRVVRGGLRRRRRLRRQRRRANLRPLVKGLQRTLVGRRAEVLVTIALGLGPRLGRRRDRPRPRRRRGLWRGLDLFLAAATADDDDDDDDNDQHDGRHDVGPVLELVGRRRRRRRQRLRRRWRRRRWGGGGEEEAG